MGGWIDFGWVVRKLEGWMCDWLTVDEGMGGMYEPTDGLMDG